jgi:hypothetical protein
MEISEEITQELIIQAKELLSKILDKEEKQIEMLRISTSGPCLSPIQRAITVWP